MTIPAISAAHGHKADTLRKHARALGYAPRGRDFHLTPREVQRVLAAIATAKPGRPRIREERVSPTPAPAPPARP